MNFRTGLFGLSALLFISHAYAKEENPVFEITDFGANYWIVEFKLPDYLDSVMNSESVNFRKIEVPGWHNYDVKAYPSLPKFSRDILIPNNSDDLRIKILSKDTIRERSLPILPSKGPIMRNEDPNLVKLEVADFYKIGGMFPKEKVEVSQTFKIRDVKGATITINPFQYDSERSELLITKSIRFKVEAKSVNRFLFSALSYGSKIDSDFYELYSRHFSNFDQHISEITLPEGEENFDEYKIMDTGTLEIFVPLAWLNKISDFVKWKKDRGYQVMVYSFDPSTVSYKEIKSEIQSQYYRSRLSHVVLIGDADQTPYYPGVSGNALGNEADPLYSLVDGDDYYPDVFVSRISVDNEIELETVLNKIIRYEREPSMGESWYSRAVGIASDQGAWSGEIDYERMDNVLNILGSFDYLNFDRFYDPSAHKNDLVDVVNQGVGFINYIGHGSSTLWGTTGFSTYDIQNNLTNTNRLPFIVSVACLNGNFKYEYGDSFAEAWLKAGTPEEGRGAVAVFASSTNQSWVPPTIGQKKISELMKEEAYESVGPLFYHGSVAVIEDNSNSAKQTFETWHVFGDSTMEIRTKAPYPIYTSYPKRINRNVARGVWIRTAAGARVVFKNETGVQFSTIADKTGAAGVEFQNHPYLKWDSKINVVVTAFNRVPQMFSIDFQ